MFLLGRFTQNSPYSYNMNEEEKLSANNPFPPMKPEETFHFEEEADTSAKAFEDTTDPTKPVETTDAQQGQQEEDEEVEEQKVPRSRFKKTLDERNAYRERLQEMEAQIAQLQESKSYEDITTSDVPSEWKELYGDSEVAVKAYKLQLKLNERREEELIQKAKQAFERDIRMETMQLEENEEIIDDQLADLSEMKGIKLTPKMEEDILTIVDKYSPVGQDGKYIPGAMFSFEDAFEIYMERQGNKVRQTQTARKQVAALQGNTTGDDVGSTSSNNYNPGWDSWRKEYGN